MPAPLQEISRQVATPITEVATPTTAPIQPEQNLVLAIYSMAVSDIRTQGRLHSEKTRLQKRLEDDVKTAYEKQKGRYTTVSKFSLGKISDGALKVAGLYFLQQGGFINNLNLLPADIFDPVRGNEARNMIVSGVSSILGQGLGTGESSYQGEIQSKGTSETEAARLAQTAGTEDTRRFGEQMTSTNQTYLQALQKAAEGIKPR